MAYCVYSFRHFLVLLNVFKQIFDTPYSWKLRMQIEFKSTEIQGNRKLN